MTTRKVSPTRLLLRLLWLVLIAIGLIGHYGLLVVAVDNPKHLPWYFFPAVILVSGWGWLRFLKRSFGSLWRGKD